MKEILSCFLATYPWEAYQLIRKSWKNDSYMKFIFGWFINKYIFSDYYLVYYIVFVTAPSIAHLNIYIFPVMKMQKHEYVYVCINILYIHSTYT